MHKTITIQADVVRLLQVMIPKGVWLNDRQHHNQRRIVFSMSSCE